MLFRSCGVNQNFTVVPGIVTTLLIPVGVTLQGGTMIFDTTSMEPGWDGMYRGQPCPKDKYVYVVNYKTVYGGSVQVKGHVTLTR